MWATLCYGFFVAKAVGGDVVCAGANSGKAASLMNNAQIPGARVQLRTCNAISRLGSCLKLLRACLASRRSGRVVFHVRGGLFSINSCLTASRARAGLHVRDHVRSRSVQVLRRTVSMVSGRLPPLGTFVLPKNSHKTTIKRVYQAIYHHTRQHVLTLTRRYSVSTHMATFIGHLSSCLFVLAQGLGRLAGASRVF